MKSAVLIIPYYGKLPPFFNYWLKSIEGKYFDVLFISDLKVDKTPLNFKYLKMSFGNIAKLATQKLLVEVKIDHPKRLCNLKPMYGKIFEDYIIDYDYWGFGDCDLVYGKQINDVLDKVLNSGYDVLSFRKHWTSGPMCFVQNNKKTNLLFQRARNWCDVATMNESDNPLFFDEIGGVFYNDLISGKKTMEDCEKIRDSFCAVISRSQDIKYFHEDVLFEDNIAGSYVHMQPDGSLFAGCNEIACFHFIGVKFRRYFTYVNNPYNRIGEYWIDDTGFFTSSMWSCRCLINPWRKMRALFSSIREHGLKQCLGRFFL